MTNTKSAAKVRRIEHTIRVMEKTRANLASIVADGGESVRNADRIIAQCRAQIAILVGA